MSDDNSGDASEALRLDHFLKISGLAETGGQAKHAIQNGEVQVNGQVETRRRRKLSQGDVVEIAGKRTVVQKP
ncbi:MAG: RNA-binding S4 domain-containing protein [Aureliella sp.]|jgi:ribosome-associated protein